MLRPSFILEFGVNHILGSYLSPDGSPKRLTHDVQGSPSPFFPARAAISRIQLNNLKKNQVKKMLLTFFKHRPAPLLRYLRYPGELPIEDCKLLRNPLDVLNEECTIPNPALCRGEHSVALTLIEFLLKKILQHLPVSFHDLRPLCFCILPFFYGRRPRVLLRRVLHRLGFRQVRFVSRTAAIALQWIGHSGKCVTVCDTLEEYCVVEQISLSDEAGRFVLQSLAADCIPGMGRKQFSQALSEIDDLQDDPEKTWPDFFKADGTNGFYDKGMVVNINESPWHRLPKGHSFLQSAELLQSFLASKNAPICYSQDTSDTNSATMGLVKGLKWLGENPNRSLVLHEPQMLRINDERQRSSELNSSKELKNRGMRFRRVFRVNETSVPIMISLVQGSCPFSVINRPIFSTVIPSESQTDSLLVVDGWINASKKEPKWGHLCVSKGHWVEKFRFKLVPPTMELSYSHIKVS